MPVIPLTRQGSDVSVRWSGYLKPPTSDAFTFFLHLGVLGGSSAEAVSAARLFIDDVLVLSAGGGSPSGAAEEAGAGGGDGGGGLYELEEGVLYRIRVEFEARRSVSRGQGGLSAPRCALLWASPRTPKQRVPSFFLYPAGEPIDGSPLPLRVFAPKHNPTPPPDTEPPTLLPPSPPPTPPPTADATAGFSVALVVTAMRASDLAEAVFVPALAGHLAGVPTAFVRAFAVNRVDEEGGRRLIGAAAGGSSGEGASAAVEEAADAGVQGSGLPSRRLWPGAADFAVSFEVVAPLADPLGAYSHATAGSFGAALTASLEASLDTDALQAALEARCGCAVEPLGKAYLDTSPLREYPTLRPTAWPTVAPTAPPSEPPTATPLPSTSPTA